MPDILIIRRGGLVISRTNKGRNWIAENIYGSSITPNDVRVTVNADVADELAQELIKEGLDVTIV